MGLTVFGAWAASAAQDPNSHIQLYRYLNGSPNPAVGDPSCNAGIPKVTHICFLNKSPPGDMRFYQATGPLTLPPGGFESIVVAYSSPPRWRRRGVPPGVMSLRVIPPSSEILGEWRRESIRSTR